MVSLWLQHAWRCEKTSRGWVGCQLFKYDGEEHKKWSSQLLPCGIDPDLWVTNGCLCTDCKHWNPWQTSEWNHEPRPYANTSQRHAVSQATVRLPTRFGRLLRRARNTGDLFFRESSLGANQRNAHGKFSEHQSARALLRCFTISELIELRLALGVFTLRMIMLG